MKLADADKKLYEQNLAKAKAEKSATAKAIYRHKMFLKVADELVALQRNSIVFDPKVVENENEIKLGATKLGGRPDLPANFEWIFRENKRNPNRNAQAPIVRGKMIPFSFLAQLDFAETKKLDVDDLLPASGRLYVFYIDTMFLADAGIWTADEATNPANLVMIFDDSDAKELVRHDFPESLPESRRYRAAKVKFGNAVDFPHSDNPQLFRDIFKKTGDAREARWIYDEKLPYRKAKSYRKNKMFGHVDAQFPYLGENEHLLLQLRDFPNGMQFSREGYLCLTVSRDDLRKRNWNNVNFSES